MFEMGVSLCLRWESLYVLGGSLFMFVAEFGATDTWLVSPIPKGFNTGGNLAMDQHPIQRSRNTPNRFIFSLKEDKLRPHKPFGSKVDFWLRSHLPSKLQIGTHENQAFCGTES